jgi:predicted GTPase
MPYGAGFVAATQAGAAEIVDPRSVATEDFTQVFTRYPHIGAVLPALGYFPSQLQTLCDIINAADIDAVVDASPCDLSKLIDIDKPVVQVSYEFEETREPRLSNLVDTFLRDQGVMFQSQ